MLKTSKTKIRVHGPDGIRLVTIRTVPPRKYRWYAIEYSAGNERFGNNYFNFDDAMYTVERRLSEELAKKAIHKYDDYSEYGAIHYINRIVAFDTKEEADNCIKVWGSEKHEQWEAYVTEKYGMLSGSQKTKEDEKE
jgi:hypothetical protein